MQFDQLKRRVFIAALGGAVSALCPIAARAQQPAKVARLGYLAPARLPSLIEALRAGLRDLGYDEGQNLAIEYRFALGQTKSYDELAQELVRLDPAAIVLTGTPAALALKRQTTTIPIILAPIGDPLALGLARSLARPGGNVTGLTMFGTELARKRLEILKEIAAGIRRIAVLANSGNPLHPFLWDDIQPIGPLLGLDLRRFAVSDLDELPTTFSAMTRDGCDALTVFTDAQFFSAGRRIAELAATHRLPAMYESREFAEDGGLISYGPNVPDLSRRAAAFVVKILKGAKPADLPIEQPTKFELVINLKTAKALGLDVPPMLLVRADEVIE
jgi:putative ABC transport system substrate-binding protein